MVKTYRLNEFAALLGVSTKTLQRWDKSGKFKSYRTPTNQRFYTDEQYEKYMKQCGQDTKNSED